MKISYVAGIVALLGIGVYQATKPKHIGRNAYNPSWLTQTLFTSPTSDYDHTVFPEPYKGNLKVLVIGTEKSDLTMANGKAFHTGNHPVETLVPMLHLAAAGFGNFDIATPTGKPLVFEMWAMPEKDEAVTGLYEKIKPQLDSPMKIEDVPVSFDGYAAIFIPGGHGAMLDLPESAHLGKLLRSAHSKSLPTLTLCHGPGTLLAAAVGAEEGEKFAYDGYKLNVFPDGFDKFTPYLGYLPGPMPWFVGDMLTAKGVEVLNTGVNGDTYVDRELVTGDSPQAANAFGKLAAQELLKKYL